MRKTLGYTQGDNISFSAPPSHKAMEGKLKKISRLHVKERCGFTSFQAANAWFL